MQRGIAWVFIGALLLGVLVARSSLISNAYEDSTYALDPTSARAYAYGEKHFDARDPSRYDLARAEYFFQKAAADPSIPYVNHQLARISFLKGDFARAISQINLQISLHGSTTQNSYYVRGLIEGFMGDYSTAARDYKRYIDHDPTNWAATNDLAWVLLKDDRPQEALEAIDKILPLWPENPWLLNSRATAAFELGRLREARTAAAVAVEHVGKLTEADWMQAYPGNDPLIAGQGLTAFQKAVVENMHTIEVALQKAENGVR